MTKIKLCGLTRLCDIDTANELRPDFIGFVFAPKSRRYVTPESATALKKHLHPSISAVGVFADEDPNQIAALLRTGIIDFAQLHGSEDEAYIKQLRRLTHQPIIQAFRIKSKQDILSAEKSSADLVLLDSGGGTGNPFDWSLLQYIHRPYFLAGGLGIDNIRTAIETLNPYAVDISSGIETDGRKDSQKMKTFVHLVRCVCTEH